MSQKLRDNSKFTDKELLAPNEKIKERKSSCPDSIPTEVKAVIKARTVIYLATLNVMYFLKSEK